MSDQTEAQRLAILSAGVTPELQVSPIDCTVLPTNDTAGYAMSGSIAAFLDIGMRRDTARVCTITIDTFDAATTYTVDIGGAGNAVVATPATQAALLTSLEAAIDAVVDGSGDPIATADIYDADGDGVDDSIRITGISATAYPCAVTLSGGSPAVTLTLDPETATAVLKVRLKGITSIDSRITDDEDRRQAKAWRDVPGSTLAITASAYTQRMEVAGYPLFRPYVSAYAGVSGDTLVDGGGVTVDLRKPMCLVYPCKAG